ncbi:MULTISPECIES: DedA family protein [Pseudonocardia]|uniref:DedA family protein n=2 Tax=Pseudonocardiaceae TaxID=2070 RepID=UPI00091B5106|nr:hypothetical protein BG618_00391 [Pseudonocardia autotrophica]
MAVLAGELGTGLLVVAAVALVVESGLLIGVVLPGISVTVGLGVLAGTGTVPGVAAGLTAAVAGAAGPSVGYWRGRRGGPAALHSRRGLPAAAGRALPLAERRPLLAVALGQWFAVVRTLVPRVTSGVLPYHRFAAVSIPVASVWGLATFALGGLLARGSATAARLVAAQEATAHLFLLALLPVVVGMLVGGLRRRRLGQPPDSPRPSRRRKPDAADHRAGRATTSTASEPSAAGPVPSRAGSRDHRSSFGPSATTTGGAPRR